MCLHMTIAVRDPCHHSKFKARRTVRSTHGAAYMSTFSVSSPFKPRTSVLVMKRQATRKPSSSRVCFELHKVMPTHHRALVVVECTQRGQTLSLKFGPIAPAANSHHLDPLRPVLVGGGRNCLHSAQCLLGHACWFWMQSSAHCTMLAADTCQMGWHWTMSPTPVV